MSSNALTILGSSSALPTSTRFPTAQVLEMLGRFFLIDCGEGTQMQLRKIKISFDSIQAIFISHLHGDHYLGIFGVLASFNLLGRTAPLTIYGPKELQKIIKFHLKYLDFQLKYSITFEALKNEDYSIIFEDRKIKIAAIKLTHRVDCWGFEFKHKDKTYNFDKKKVAELGLDRHQLFLLKNGKELTENTINVSLEDVLISEEFLSYVFITDTLYKPELIQYIKDPSLLYHESTFMHDLSDRALSTFHSTTTQAALFAKECNAKKLILGHYSARYKDLAPLLDEAKQIFNNTVLSNDLLRISF